MATLIWKSLSLYCFKITPVYLERINWYTIKSVIFKQAQQLLIYLPDCLTYFESGTCVGACCWTVLLCSWAAQSAIRVLRLACSDDCVRNHGYTIISVFKLNIFMVMTTTTTLMIFICWIHVNGYFRTHFIFEKC